MLHVFLTRNRKKKHNLLPNSGIHRPSGLGTNTFVFTVRKVSVQQTSLQQRRRGSYRLHCDFNNQEVLLPPTQLSLLFAGPHSGLQFPPKYLGYKYQKNRITDLSPNQHGPNLISIRPPNKHENPL